MMLQRRGTSFRTASAAMAALFFSQSTGVAQVASRMSPAPPAQHPRGLMVSLNPETIRPLLGEDARHFVEPPGNVFVQGDGHGEGLPLPVFAPGLVPCPG